MIKKKGEITMRSCHPFFPIQKAAAVGLVAVGLLLLLCCVPFWVFCCVLGAVMIVLGLRMI